MVRALACLFMSFLLWLAPDALAQAPDDVARREEARAAFVTAVEAAKQNRWEAAHAEFNRSYALRPSPVTLLNIAGCEVQLGKLVAARRTYLAILAAPEHAGDHVAAVERILVQLDARIPRLRIEGNLAQDGDVLVLDGAQVVALRQPLFLDPGSHHVALDRGGTRLVERRFDVAEREVFELDLDELCRHCTTVPKTPLVEPVPTPAPESRPLGYTRTARVLPWTLLSVGAGALVGAVVLGPMALSEDRELARGCGETGDCRPHQVRRADRLALAADLSLGVGISLAVAAGLGFWLRKPRPFHVGPMADVRVVGVAAGMTY